MESRGHPAILSVSGNGRVDQTFLAGHVRLRCTMQSGKQHQEQQNTIPFAWLTLERINYHHLDCDNFEPNPLLLYPLHQEQAYMLLQ